MANFVDENELLEGSVNEEISQVTEQPQEPQAQETPAQEPEVVIPEKYKGKSVEEIVKMHQEAEKMIGRQAQEVHEVYYALLVVIGSDTLVSFSTLNPTTTIDSLRLVDVEGNGPPINTTGKYVELMAKDRKGPGDFYWVKTFRNDSFLNNISQLNISADMGNTSRGQDGDLFIYPVRYNGVNDFSRSFKTGETVRIEIHSINAIAFAWFNLVVSENQNGGLFATPPANIFTNVVSFNPNKKTAIGGFFCMSAVTAASVTIP
jgi:hypothetical protein